MKLNKAAYAIDGEKREEEDSMKFRKMNGAGNDFLTGPTNIVCKGEITDEDLAL